MESGVDASGFYQGESFANLSQQIAKASYGSKQEQIFNVTEGF